MITISDELMKEVEELAPPKPARWTEERLGLLAYLHQKGYSQKEMLKFFSKKYPEYEWTSNLLYMRTRRMLEQGEI